MKSIGGYFELELLRKNHFHEQALKLNSGRNCLEYILKAREYKKIYIPYFTCEVILEPIHKLGLDFQFYSINSKLEPIFDFEIELGAAFLYTNYFGLKQNFIESLSHSISNLIIDNSQAFYAAPLMGIDTFYSARKFFGVSDGAYLYINKLIDEPLERDYSYNRMSHLLKRLDVGPEEAYSDFLDNDLSFKNEAIKGMSQLTNSILSSIDYKNVAKIRRENFLFLHSQLKEINQFKFDFKSNDVPMVYPFLVKSQNLRKNLISNKIFVATYWPNVFDWCEKESLEYYIAYNIIPIPIDQRYGISDMQSIVNIIKK